jgi:hypothetical protein
MSGTLSYAAGMAGKLNSQQLSTLLSCLPPGAVASCEADAAVQRAEGQQTAWLSDEPGTITADSAAADSTAGRRMLQLKPRRSAWRRASHAAAAQLMGRRRLHGSLLPQGPKMWIEDAAGPTGASSIALLPINDVERHVSVHTMIICTSLQQACNGI